MCSTNGVWFSFFFLLQYSFQFNVWFGCHWYVMVYLQIYVLKTCSVCVVLPSDTYNLFLGYVYSLYLSIVIQVFGILVQHFLYDYPFGLSMNKHLDLYINICLTLFCHECIYYLILYGAYQI